MFEPWCKVTKVCDVQLGAYQSFFFTAGLKEYALTSSLRDSRFPPIGRDEFSKLTVSVSILQVSRA